MQYTILRTVCLSLPCSYIICNLQYMCYANMHSFSAYCESVTLVGETKHAKLKCMHAPYIVVLCIELYGILHVIVCM